MTFVFEKKRRKILKWNNLQYFPYFFIGGVILKCRMCGFEFDENKLENRGCTSCGKHDCCNQIHCPNCGFGNHPEFEEEFEIINKLKNRIKTSKKIKINF